MPTPSAKSSIVKFSLPPRDRADSRPDHPDYPVTIFGRLPAGFELRNQSLYLLAHWHRKALKAISDLKDDANEKELDAACKIARDIFEAILAADEVEQAGEVAVQLIAAVEVLDHEKNDSIEDALDVDDLRRLANNLTKATAAPRPTKRRKLVDRARSAFKGLKIDAEHYDRIGDRMRREKTK